MSAQWEQIIISVSVLSLVLSTFWLVTAAGYLDGFVEGRLMRRHPRIPLEGIQVAKYPMYVNCAKAVDELGLPQGPVERALRNAVEWFSAHGYVEGGQRGRPKAVWTR